MPGRRRSRRSRLSDPARAPVRTAGKPDAGASGPALVGAVADHGEHRSPLGDRAACAPPRRERAEPAVGPRHRGLPVDEDRQLLRARHRRRRAGRRRVLRTRATAKTRQRCRRIRTGVRACAPLSPSLIGALHSLAGEAGGGSRPGGAGTADALRATHRASRSRLGRASALAACTRAPSATCRPRPSFADAAAFFAAAGRLRDRAGSRRLHDRSQPSLPSRRDRRVPQQLPARASGELSPRQARRTPRGCCPAVVRDDVVQLPLPPSSRRSGSRSDASTSACRCTDSSTAS